MEVNALSSTAIIRGLRMYYTLKSAQPDKSRQFVHQIERIIYHLENDNATVDELLQVMKKLDELITKIEFEYDNIVKVERALDNLRNYVPLEQQHITSI